MPLPCMREDPPAAPASNNGIWSKTVSAGVVGADNLSPLCFTGGAAQDAILPNPPRILFAAALAGVHRPIQSLGEEVSPPDHTGRLPGFQGAQEKSPVSDVGHTLGNTWGGVLA